MLDPIKGAHKTHGSKRDPRGADDGRDDGGSEGSMYKWQLAVVQLKLAPPLSPLFFVRVGSKGLTEGHCVRVGTKGLSKRCRIRDLGKGLSGRICA